MPFKIGKRRLATGLALQHESYGLYRNMTLGAMIAYRMKFLGGTLSPGLRIGLLNRASRARRCISPMTTTSTIPPTKLYPRAMWGGNALDLGAGLTYERRGFMAGVSVLHANSPTVRFTSDGIGSGAISGSRDGTPGDTPSSPEGVKITNFM